VPRCPEVVLDFSDEVAAAQPAATSIIVRESASGPEVLLLRRSEALRHMPGLWVFPGGKVEPDDPGDSALERARTAAARELAEEAGVAVDAAALQTFSHWLTPLVVKRRFSTWFFLAEVPPGTPVEVDGQEMTEYQWSQPGLAIQAHQQGELALTPPTLVSLYDIASLASASDLSGAVTAREAPQFFPNVVRQAAQMVFLYHGDIAYESGDLTLQGPLHRTTADSAGIFSYQPLSTDNAL